MAWDDEMIPLVRGLVNDLTPTSYTYTDEQLREFILYAAHFSLSEVYFSTTYVVDLTLQSITPDPSTPTRDTSFINIVALKAAIFIVTGEVKTAASQAVRINDGPSMVDLTLIYKAKSELLKSMKADFDRAKIAMSVGDNSVGESVLTSYTQENATSSSYYR